MLKSIGIVFFIATLLSGCATNTASTGSITNLTPSYIREASMKIGETTYTYEFTQKQLASEVAFLPIEDEISRIKSKAENNLWPDERLKKEIDNYTLSAGKGYFQVTGYSLTIGMSSNGVICAMLVQDNTKIEERCMSGTANIPGSNGLWWNLTMLTTRKLDNTKPFEVRVVNTISNQTTKMVFTPKTPQ